MHECMHFIISRLCERGMEEKKLHVYFFVVIETKEPSLLYNKIEFVIWCENKLEFLFLFCLPLAECYL